MQSVYAKPKYIVFLGDIGLLISFEFINVYLHPKIEKWTADSPILILAAMAIVASVLVPFHHKMEMFVQKVLVVRNRKMKEMKVKELEEEIQDSPDELLPN